MSGLKVSKGGVSAHFDGMSWPLPGERLERLEHTLRYGEPTQEDLLLAASVLSAYGAMVASTSRSRAHVVQMLRKAMEQTL